MIGVGIVGCNYGRTVLLPAFRHDQRCDIVALAGTGPDGIKAGIAVAVTKDLVERGVSADAIARPAAKAPDKMRSRLPAPGPGTIRPCSTR